MAVEEPGMNWTAPLESRSEAFTEECWSKVFPNVFSTCLNKLELLVRLIWFSLGRRTPARVCCQVAYVSCPPLPP